MQIVSHLNGLNVLIWGDPFTVGVLGETAYSIAVVDWQANNTVFVIFSSGPLGGIKSDVYTAVPLTTRTLLTNPLKSYVALPSNAPIRKALALLPQSVSSVNEFGVLFPLR